MWQCSSVNLYKPDHLPAFASRQLQILCNKLSWATKLSLLKTNQMNFFSKIYDVLRQFYLPNFNVLLENVSTRRQDLWIQLRILIHSTVETRIQRRSSRITEKNNISSILTSIQINYWKQFRNTWDSSWHYPKKIGFVVKKWLSTWPASDEVQGSSHPPCRLSCEWAHQVFTRWKKGGNGKTYDHPQFATAKKI